MKIALEIQPVLKDKTGVGWYTQKLIEHLPDEALEYEGLGFNFLGRNSIQQALDAIPLKTKICKLIPYGLYRRLWRFIPVSYNALFDSNADVFHFFNYIVPYNIKGKVVVTVYDMVYKLFPETMDKRNYVRLERELKRSVERADVVVTISQNSKKEIVDILNIEESKVEIIYPGVEMDRFRKEYTDKQITDVRKKYRLPSKYLLYLGTLEPRKNIISIIKAYQEFISKNDDEISLVLAGKKGWMYNNIFETVKKLNLENRVNFTGYIDEKDKPLIYKMAEAFIYPSLYEGFGMPLLEAMAAGIPVIVSETSSLPEVAGNAGVFVNPYDIEEITNAIERVVYDLDFKTQIIKKGLRQCRKFSWEKSAKKLVSIYKKLGGLE